MDQAEDSSEVVEANVGEKRTRRGENFLSIEDVTLHSTDFTMAEHRAARILAGPPAVADLPGTFSYSAPAGRAVSFGSASLSVLGDLEAAYEAACMAALSQRNNTEAVRPQPTASGTAAPSPWETHYQRTQNHFYPIKNYLHRAFPAIAASLARTDREVVVMECGCGNGSALLPFLRLETAVTSGRFIVFDISATAVRLFRDHAVTQEFLSKRRSAAPPLAAFACDVGRDDLSEALVNRSALPAPTAAPSFALGTVDNLLLIFVLCALPDIAAMRHALRGLAAWLRPGTHSDGDWSGGRLHFRDYGVLDHSMMRLLERPAAAAASSSGAPSPFLVKGDGTSQLYFTAPFAVALFAECGFTPLAVEMHCNEVVNRKNGVRMRKVFINAEFGVLAAGSASATAATE